MILAKSFQQHQLYYTGPQPNIFSNNLRNGDLERKQPFSQPYMELKDLTTFSILSFDVFWIVKLCFYSSPYKVCRQIFSWNNKNVAWGKFL